MIRIVLVDDHKMMRDGLRAYLEREQGVEVIAEAKDGREAIRLVKEHLPDVVVMDIALPKMNGVEATRQITAAHPDVKVVALSTHCDKRYVLSMLDAGAAGYVDKVAAGEELLRAVRSVSRGDCYLSPAVTGLVVSRSVTPVAAEAREADTGPSRVTVLGPREREVLQLIAEGHSSPQIAEDLHISKKTVETHRRNIGRKLGLRSVAELTKYAVRHGLTPLDG